VLEFKKMDTGETCSDTEYKGALWEWRTGTGSIGQNGTDKMATS